MRPGTPIPPARRLGASALAVAATLGAAGGAQAQVAQRLTGDISLREGYSSNPFLSSDADTDSGFAELALSPTYLLTEPLATTKISATYRRTEYYRRVGSSTGLGVSAEHQRQLSGRMTLNLAIQYDSSIAGERQAFVPSIIPGLPQGPDQPAEPGQPDVPTGPDLPDIGNIQDPTVIGIRQRVKSLVVNGSLQTQLTALDIVTLSAQASEQRYNTSRLADSRTVGTTIGYNRTLSESSSVGARISLERSYYTEPSPDSSIYQPQLTYSGQWGERIRFTAALGGLFITSSDGTTSRGVSGNLDACRSGERSRLCLTVMRDASASGAGGVRKRFSTSASYSYQLGPYDSFSYNLGYGRYSGRSRLEPASKYVSQDLTWQERLSERIFGGVSATYRASDQSFLRTDYGLHVFLRVTLEHLP